MALDSLSPLNPLSSVSGPIATAVTGAVSDAVSGAVSNATSGITDWFSAHLGQIVCILLGLMLVAAGIFQFDKVQQTVGYAARAAA